MAYIGKSPDGTGVRSRFYYTQSSGGGTSVSGSSDDGTSLAFSDGAYVDVFLNGVLLVAGTDYNTTTTNTIAGLAALANGDVVEVVVYDIFTVADTVSSLNGGAFSGAVTVPQLNADNIRLDGNTISSTDTNGDITLDPNGTGDTKVDNGDFLFVEEASSSPYPEQKIKFSNDSTTTNGFYIAQDSSRNGKVWHEQGLDVLFGTSNTERMRISSGGKILCGIGSSFGGGATGTIETFHSGTAALGVGRSDTDLGGCVRFFKVSSGGSGTQVGEISIGSSSTSYSTSSDARLKENIADMTGAIDRVKALAPKRFNFIVDADTTVDGFLAHEAQAVVPEAVTGTKDEVDEDGNAVMQGIDQSKLVPLLTGALQEAIAKIETLESKVAALEAGS